jgi:hypothetical protein
MLLSPGYQAVAHKLQEAATGMCHEDIRARLADCLQDLKLESDYWGCYVVAVFGDDKAGDVVYSCKADLKKAPYTMSPDKTTIDTAAAVDVLPITTYEIQSEVAALEAGARNSKRDLRQLQTIHDSAVGLGANCTMAEASRGGVAGSPSYNGVAKSSSTPGTSPKDGVRESSTLPAAPSSGSEDHGHESLVRRKEPDTSGNPLDRSQESDIQGVNRQTFNKSSLTLVESASTVEKIVLQESKADYEIKLIAPGLGSSAFYPAEVLKRDGPKVFKEGTHVYLNHPTAAEEAQRPEGDVKNLAGVLSSTAVYYESHAKGPGLYARMKVFADHAQQVEEKAAHVGMSIRASGLREGDKTHEGRPILKELTSAESVDVVTKAGAGGMILTEAALPPNPTQEAAMDAAELQKLRESVATANASAAAANAANAKLLERALRGDAREEALRILAGITLPETSRLRVIDSVLKEALPKTEAGELDTVKFSESVNAEAKREGVYVASLTGAGNVTGMGTPGEPIRTAEAEKPEEINARAIKIFERLGHSKEAAERAVKGRVA